METLNSKITHVTVFKDRAEITRTAVITLDAGQHTLTFDYLPEEVDKDSIQVKGEGQAELSNVAFKTSFNAFEMPNKTEWEAQKAQAIEKRDVIGEQIARLEQEKEFVVNLLHKFTHAEGGQSGVEIDIQKWNTMLAFYQDKVASLDGQLRTANQAYQDQRKVVNKLEQAYYDEESKTSSKNQFVEVLLEVTATGQITLKLSYLVKQVRWHPVYDIRLNTQKKWMHLTYRAVIRQNTGETWQDVTLKISTAQPGLQGKHPDLKPWRIHKTGKHSGSEHTSNEKIVYRYYDEMNPTEQEKLLQENQMLVEQMRAQEEEMRQNMEMLQATQEAMHRNHLEAEALRQGKSWVEEEELEEEIGETESILKTGATSVVFEINGQHTIVNNNETHKINITSAEFPVGFRYSTVPKLSPLAYLKAKSKNTTAFPFLRGRANIFLDNNFVPHTKMLGVAPKEEFWTFFGVDRGLHIYHKFLRKYEKTSGNVFGKKMHTITYEYEIEVTNHKQTTEEIIVWDQLPISSDEAIKVHLLQPNPKEKEPPIKYYQTEVAFIQWHAKLTSGEKIVIPFSFAIEYPEGTDVMGL